MSFQTVWFVIVFMAFHVQHSDAVLAPLYATVSKLEWHHNIKFVNVSVEVIKGEQGNNKSYVIDMVAMRDMKHGRLFATYSVLSFNGALQNLIFSRTVDLCQFIKRPSMDRLIKILYENIKRNSTLPTRCPICYEQTAKINIDPSSMPIPGFFPESDFLLEVFLYTGIRQELVFETRWTGRLKKL